MKKRKGVAITEILISLFLLIILFTILLEQFNSFIKLDRKLYRTKQMNFIKIKTLFSLRNDIESIYKFMKNRSSKDILSFIRFSNDELRYIEYKLVENKLKRCKFIYSENEGIGKHIDTCNIILDIEKVETLYLYKKYGWSLEQKEEEYPYKIILNIKKVNSKRKNIYIEINLFMYKII